MLAIFTVVLISASFLKADLYDNGKYFDVNDRLKADCFLQNVDYNYLGQREQDINNHDCALWIDVFHGVHKGNYSNVHPGEVAIHRKCRSLSLSGSSIMKGEQGPWCYISDSATSSYKASQCFPECQGKPKRVKSGIPKSYGRTLGTNYNQAIIDHIEKYFIKYKWGPDKYYKEKPSELALTVKYHSIKKQIFWGCIGAFFIITVIVGLCYLLKKMAENSRRKRDIALQEILKESHGKIPKIISRPAPN